MPKEFANAQNLVSIKEVRDDAVVLKDGGLRRIVMVGGMNFSLKSSDEQNAVTNSYQNFLNSVDFPMQIVIHSRKANVEKYLNLLASQRETEPSPLLKNQMDEYIEFIRGFTQKNAIMEKTFLLVIPYVPVSVSAVTKGLVSQFMPTAGKGKNKKKKGGEEKAEVEDESSFQDALMQLNQRVSQVVEGLAAVGLEAAPLTTEALIELFYNLYNPESVERENINLPQAK